MHIEASISIACPRERVWAFVADACNDPRWCEKVVSVEQVSGDGPGPGARYTVTHRPRPMRPPTELAVAVVEFEPPRRLRWREQDDDGVFDVLYRLESEDGGTRLSQIDEIDWRISRLALPIARLMVSRDLARQLAALKRLLEARGQPPVIA